MKARTPPTTYKDIEKAVAEEMERQEPEIFKKHAAELIPQTFAVVLWTMAVSYGWKKKRLRKLVEALHDTDYLMENPSRLHHRFGPLELEREIKEKYGIDLRTEFPIKVEVQR